MSPLAIAAIVVVCSFSAGLIGLIVHDRLPDTHLSTESRDAVKNVMGLIAAMSALVLGLLVASANATYDRTKSELTTLSANVILLDRTLQLYGPDARPVRNALRDTVGQILGRIWSPAGVRPEDLNSTHTQIAGNAGMELLLSLAPKTDAQRAMLSRALQESETIAQQRLLMFAQLGNAIPWPFLAVLIFWVSMLFLGFGLLARFNAMVIVALLLGALSIAGAIFLILELNDPYRGLMRISDAPLRAVLALIDR